MACTAETMSLKYDRGRQKISTARPAIGPCRAPADAATGDSSQPSALAEPSWPGTLLRLRSGRSVGPRAGARRRRETQQSNVWLPSI